MTYDLARNPARAETPGTAATVPMTYGEAVRAALRRCLGELPETIFYGEDVAVPGGVFGVTRGLRKEFGDRVFDTPISESAILGSAVGAAMLGRRPIIEIMWIDFSLVAFDQIVNQLANVRYQSRGLLRAPVVIRTQQGVSPGSCAQHSQSLEAFLLHVPGIRVAMPATAQDAYDVLVSAVYSDDPVVVIENQTLYNGGRQDVAVNGPVAPPGGSRLRRPGSDVTLVSWGSITTRALEAADRLDGEGISAEVIETPWLNPFPLDDVLRSVTGTRRLAVMHEANVTGGFGAELVARVCEAGIPLQTPPRRIGVPDSRIPAAPSLVGALVPTTDRMVAEVRSLF